MPQYSPKLNPDELAQL
ncbi:hypothetical protein ACIODX_37685 [Streptomyces sp. NPDC088190]